MSKFHKAVHFSQNPKLGIALIPGRGPLSRGIVANENIKKNEILERCPAVPIPAEEEEKYSGSLLDWYFIPYGETGCAMVGGYAMFYNHGDNANADYYTEEGVGFEGSPTVTFWALRNISAGEEITIDYTGGDGKIVWTPNGMFEVHSDED